MCNNVPEAVDQAPVRCVIAERNMRTPPIIIGGEFRKDPPQVLFVEHDQMIGTLAPDRPDQTFNMAVLPGRAEGRGPIPNAHRLDAASEYAAEGSVVVADDVCWRLVPGECLGNLACQPLRRRMPGNRKPQQLPPSVAENKKCEELLKGNRRNYKEINRRDPVSVVVKEGLPSLRGATSPRYHVLRDCRLGDVEAELQKLAVDMRRNPERVLEAHPSDKVAHLFVDLRSTTERT